MKDSKTYDCKKGEVILEEMNALHNGYDSGSDAASLVVFYTGAVGAVGMPIVIKEEPQATTALK